MDITVVGNAQVTARPELATMRLTVSAEGAGADGVVAQVSVVVARIEADLVELSAPAGRRQSPVAFSSVSPVQTSSWRPYDPDGTPQEPRFTATVQVSVEFRDVEALAVTADAWGRRDGVQLDGVEWALGATARDTLEATLLSEAVKDAFAKARIIAWAAGASDITPVAIAEPGLLDRTLEAGGSLAFAQSAAASAPRGAAMADAGVAAALAIRPADIDLTASVHARFKA